MTQYALLQTLNSNEAVSETTSIRSFFENLIMQQQSETQPLKEELERYLALPSTQSKLLFWWHQYKSKFLILLKLAYNYLFIQETSVPSKQAFSTASHTIIKVCNCLNLEIAHAFLCLKSWMKQNAEQ